jgi:hypothetical protein
MSFFLLHIFLAQSTEMYQLRCWLLALAYYRIEWTLEPISGPLRSKWKLIFDSRHMALVKCHASRSRHVYDYCNFAPISKHITVCKNQAKNAWLESCFTHQHYCVRVRASKGLGSQPPLLSFSAHTWYKNTIICIYGSPCANYQSESASRFYIKFVHHAFVCSRARPRSTHIFKKRFHFKWENSMVLVAQENRIRGSTRLIFFLIINFEILHVI